MPTYDYYCEKCGSILEYFQQTTKILELKCPKCNRKMKRMVGKGGQIIFKGSGFYENDYKKKGL